GGGRDAGIVEYKELKLAPSDDKSQRTEVHKAFRVHFEGFLDTKTQDDSVVVMVVGRADRRGARPAGTGGRSDAANQRKRQWPTCWGDYLQFVLYKENKDTTAAVGLLAKFTNARASRFSYAGTKDKRGVTTQHMTIYHMRAEQLRGLNAKLYGMRVGNFSYVSQQLRLGDLFGNRFSVVLREVSASEEEINHSLTELKRTGFVNYYGLQRFGTGSVATHRVGIALLQGQWKEAADLILQPRTGEEQECESARKYWAETGDIN
ncbi:RNA binding, putative, partial [Acanthamoeba castellanii str. Neff]